ncbi:alpha/beta hydrolase [Parapedobacter koreensis]|uniref:Alpha/beta hydrolase family protein n=1 Tax=Parapedobacter koreensis TaxID=332977 RepID=A0A1H7UHJ6_9SPHI|nr:alpha/beta hydrolase [Parapedobacter koreensis]SEL96235.1 Alpha/beta hydrolase family protein [Parapedobacter koreensis]
MAKKWSFRRILRMVWIIGGLTFMAWQLYSYQSHDVDKGLLEDGGTVRVEQNGDYYLFIPADVYGKVLLFYPGAMVDPRAYVPLCRTLADSGIQVYLMKMPWRLAIYGYNKPKELHLLDDTTKTYILAGHSQGAKMAAQFVYENPDLVDRLILIASTHPRDISLADSRLPILKIYGSRDGVADEADILPNKPKLPMTTEFVRIDGANHAQFGYYGFQLGDNNATISREQQQAETVKSMLGFIN